MSKSEMKRIKVLEESKLYELTESYFNDASLSSREQHLGAEGVLKGWNARQEEIDKLRIKITSDKILKDHAPTFSKLAVNEAHEKIKELKIELDSAETYKELAIDRQNEIKELESQLARMREALEFYADIKNWDVENGICRDMVSKRTDKTRRLWSVLDMGERARQALLAKEGCDGN